MQAPTEASILDIHAFPSARTFAAFAVAAVAASTLSEWTRKTLRLPLITGYILGGILCGPFAIAVLSRPQCLQLSHIITDDAMGFIGFSAGSKFLLSELEGSLKSVLSLLFGLVSVTYLLVLGGLSLASPYLQLTADEPPHQRLGIILIIACLAVARSPSSAIALVSELSAHGTFTTAALSVTVLMDVVVVLLFALTLLVVHAIAPAEDGTPPPSIGAVLGLFGLQMLISAVVGVLLGYALHLFISCTTHGVTAAVQAHEEHQAGAKSGGTPGADVPPAPSPPPSPPDAPQAAALPGNVEPPRKVGGAVSFAAEASATGGEARPRPPLRRFNSVIGASAHGGTASAAAAAALVAAKEQASGEMFATSEAASHRRAAFLALLWLGAKLGLNLVESLVMQLTGFEVFDTESLEERTLGVALHQPLVITMAAGFVITNFTSSRRSFLRILHDSSEPVYIAFFTLTGMTLQLDALLPNLPTAALIFSLRFVGIAIGSYWGGRLGGSQPEHYNRFWMAFITQAGVALGLAQRVAGMAEFSFGPALALCVTAEVVVNQLLGPLLFKAAIIAVGEAHTDYAPADGAPAKLGVTPPSRPTPRSAVVVAPAGDPEARAVCARLRRRGWHLATCDASFTIEALAARAADVDEPAPYTPARRAARLAELAQHTTDADLLAHIASLTNVPPASPAKAAAVAPTATRPSHPPEPPARATRPSPPRAKARSSFSRLFRAPPAVAALAEPLLTDPEQAGGDASGGATSEVGGGMADLPAAGSAPSAEAIMELSLLYAVASLESLDVIVLILPTDEEALRVCSTLRTSASLLQIVHRRQTTRTQLVVRVRDAAGRVALEASDATSPFVLTPVAADAAVPNLVAEVLHPECHWSHELDNEMR